jgi:hypothetical protein
MHRWMSKRMNELINRWQDILIDKSPDVNRSMDGKDGGIP